jgi:hypothetical protein
MGDGFLTVLSTVICGYLCHLRIGISDLGVFGVCSEVDFLFQKSLILEGAVFVSGSLERRCEFDRVHKGLNIGI